MSYLALPCLSFIFHHGKIGTIILNLLSSQDYEEESSGIMHVTAFVKCKVHKDVEKLFSFLSLLSAYGGLKLLSISVPLYR